MLLVPGPTPTAGEAETSGGLALRGDHRRVEGSDAVVTQRRADGVDHQQRRGGLFAVLRGDTRAKELQRRDDAREGTNRKPFGDVGEQARFGDEEPVLDELDREYERRSSLPDFSWFGLSP